MSASGKSSGKGGMPSPGGGKGGGETSPTPMPGMPNNYNVANDVYGSGLRINQPMSGYYNQFPAPGNNYAPPVYPDPPKPPPVVNDPNAGMIQKPGYINNSPEMQSAYGAGAGNQASANELAAFNLGVPDLDGDGRLSDDEFTSWDGYGAYSEKNGPGILLSGGPGGSDGSRFTGQYGADGKPIYSSGFMAAPAASNGQQYSPYGGGYSSFYSGGGYSPYGGSSNAYAQQQGRFPQAAQTVRPGQVQDQGTPFDRLIAQATNQPTQAPAQPPAQAPSSVQNADGTYNFNHPVHGMMNDLSKHGYDSMVADAAQISGQAAPATVTDPRATASGNGRYSFNHPVYGQIDDLTEEGLQSMIASSGGVSSFGIY